MWSSFGLHALFVSADEKLFSAVKYSRNSNEAAVQLKAKELHGFAFCGSGIWTTGLNSMATTGT